MSNELITLSHQLAEYEPRLRSIMPPSTANSLSAERLIQTIMLAAERQPQLLQCTRDSLMQSVITAANLALPVDGVTGQGYLIPRRDHGVLKAQFQLGYKGAITLGARARWIIGPDIIYENDPHRIVRGTAPHIDHEIVTHKRSERGNPQWVYATARSLDFPAISAIMTVGEVLERKARSQAAASGKKSPWDTDPKAMFHKTVILELGRRLPLDSIQKALAVDEAGDTRGFAYIDEGGLVHVEGTVASIETGDQDVAGRLRLATESGAPSSVGSEPSDTTNEE